MSQELVEDPLSEEECASADSFMGDAADILEEDLESSDFQIWRGKQKSLSSTTLESTIIVSQSPTDWGENCPRDGFLLRIQQRGMRAYFDVEIGKEVYGSSMPFGGGWSPIERVRNLAKKIAHLNLSIAGSQLSALLSERIMNLCNCVSVHSAVCESGGQTLYRCDVHRGLTDEDWFCVAFLLNEKGQVGIWTRDDFQRLVEFHEVDFEHDFTKSAEVGWVDDVLLSDSVLDELA